MPLAAVQWSQGVEDAWSNVARFVPQFLGFLVILVIGYFIAKALAKVTDRVLERVGFDKAVERGGIRRALAQSRYDASDLIGKVVFYGLMLFVLQLAFGVFGANPISDLITGVIAYLPKLIAAILIVVVGAAVATAVKDIVTSALGGLGYGRNLGTAASAAILVLAGFMALDQLQIARSIVNLLFTALVFTVAGIAVVAVGGAGIRPMQQRWQNVLDRYDEEKPKVRNQMDINRTAAAQKRIDLTQPAANGYQGQGYEIPDPAPAAPAAGSDETRRLR